MLVLVPAEISSFPIGWAKKWTNGMSGHICGDQVPRDISSFINDGTVERLLPHKPQDPTQSITHRTLFTQISIRAPSLWRLLQFSYRGKTMTAVPRFVLCQTSCKAVKPFVTTQENLKQTVMALCSVFSNNLKINLMALLRQKQLNLQ